MRGSDERSGELFSYVDLEDRVPTAHPLRLIRRIVHRLRRVHVRTAQRRYRRVLRRRDAARHQRSLERQARERGKAEQSAYIAGREAEVQAENERLTLQITELETILS